MLRVCQNNIYYNKNSKQYSISAYLLFTYVSENIYHNINPLKMLLTNCVSGFDCHW